METKATVAQAPAATARAAPNRGGALLYWTAAAILVWCSIWIFLFQHATHQQQTLLQLPVLSILAFAALLAAGRLRRPGPWACWLGAALVYAALSSVFPPSFFTSWRQTSELWLSVALSLPVFLLLGQAGLGPRLLCAICAVLALAGLLDNLGVDLRAGIAALLNSDPAAEGTRIAIAADRDSFFYAMSRRANEVWALFLGWIALAAMRPATRRDWLVAGGLFTVIGLVIATGYSWGAKLAFVIGIIAFITALTWPRLTRRLSLLALLALFLGAPLWGKQVWPWFLDNLELFDWLNTHLDADRGVRRFGLWEIWAALVDRHPWIGLGFNAHRGLPGLSFSETFGGPLGPLGVPEIIRECAYATCETVAGFPHNFALQVWGELGAFGAFLVAGLTASLLVNTLPAGGFPGGERDPSRAARYALLVVVVVIYSFDRVPWTMQNVIQFALLGGLVAATAGTRHPTAAVALPGLTLRRERFLILLALLAGALALLGNSAQAHFATRSYTPHNTEFDPERARMRHQGKELDFAFGVEGDIGSISRQPVFRQFATWQEPIGDAVTVSGWASDAFRAGETLLAFVFDGTELLGVTRTGRVRPAMQKISPETNLDLLFSGFELRALRPPGWLPRQGVNAVFVGPQGRAGLARLSEAARGQLEAMDPRPPYRPGALALGRDNMLIYLKEECEDSDIAPPFFLHVTPVDLANLPPFRRRYGFASLDFHFEELGTRQEGRCEVRVSLPDYDIVDIHIGQFEGENLLWERRISFSTPPAVFRRYPAWRIDWERRIGISPLPAPGAETQDETADP